MGKKRLKQTPLSSLEHLPNEIFIEIFSYLNGVDSVFAFSNLNNRFHCLLFEYCQFFDFKSISKKKFDFILRQHDTQRWKSLQLSNDDDTPGQIGYFLQNYSLVKHFSQLESISILKLKVAYRYEIIIDQLRFLRNLHSLTIESICGRKMIHFNLPKLKRLVISSCRNTKWIMDLLQLESLEYTITNCGFCQTDLIWPLTLKQLKIIFIKDEDILLVQKSLVHLSQLITLEIYQKERGRLLPNGGIWEILIRSSIPLLQNFKFYFQFEYLPYPPDQIKDIVASFSTAFYLIEKNWFIHCEISNIYRCHAILYSLPFPFQRFTTFRSYRDKIISTLPENYINNSYNNLYTNVKTLEIDNKYAASDDFKNTEVVNLIINADFACASWSHILNKLCHLSFERGATMSSQEFRIVLDNTPHLYSLAVEKNMLRTLTDNWRNVSVCHHLSNKIRSLKFHLNGNQSQYLNKSDFHHIGQVFVGKCQHLSLSIQSQIDIIGLILRRMKQLPSLHVHIIENLDLIITMKWLDQEQTKYNESNCIIIKEEQDYYFWLGKHP